MPRRNLIHGRLRRALCPTDTTVEFRDPVDPYALPPEVSVDILLVDDPNSPKAFEVLRVDSTEIGTENTRTIMTRAIEGTAPRQWPEGTHVTLALTPFNFTE